jgi:hypothetical protein
LKIHRWTAALVFFAASAGLSQTPPAAKPAPKQPRNVSDAEIEKAIRARFAASKIGVNAFQVRVQGGTAFLEGRTGVVQHKGTATRLAKAAGAKKVVNRIEISQEAREKAAANLSRGRRRAQVKRGAVRSETRSGPQ